MMKKLLYFFSVPMVVAVMATTIVACSKDDPKQDYNPLIDDPKPQEQPSEPDASPVGRTEQYRPQIHFTPAKNWMNDPNGMVYVGGVYHLFYQYNPQGNAWGNMSWGHATSTDLVHWTEQSVALTRDALGDVFSGSAVVDKDNTAGFGAGAMVAIYTASGDRQQQAIAYSTNGGETFSRFAGNPVIANTSMPDFRDPKVFWHEPTKRWIMSLAKGWDYAAEFWASTDLKSWTRLSEFRIDRAACNRGQWECPDLLQFGDKWVLIVSVNPGGPVLGSGTMYFVGQFDGTTFTADNLDYPLWLDYGMDNYAGVTWSNTANRKLLIGWMNNWQYAGDVPCSPWRSAMTLPRELKLQTINGTTLLTAEVASEMSALEGQWQTVSNGQAFAKADAYHVQLTLDITKSSTVTLQNAQGEQFVFDVSATERTLVSHRTAASGRVNFNGMFSIPTMRAPLNAEGNQVVIDLYIDQSSVELLSNHGAMSQTSLVFPTSIYNAVSVTGADATIRVSPMTSIWK